MVSLSCAIAALSGIWVEYPVAEGRWMKTPIYVRKWCVYSHVGCAWAPMASASSLFVEGSRALPYHQSRASVKPPYSRTEKRGHGHRMPVVPTSIGNIRLFFSSLFHDEGKGRRSSVAISRHQSSSVAISRHQPPSVAISRHQSSSFVIIR